jgi:hypothetical protein
VNWIRFRHFAMCCVIALVGNTTAETWYAGDFLAIGVGPGQIGKGGAVIATASGPEATYWNPAGLADASVRSVTLEHAERFAGVVTHDVFMTALPINKGALGLMVFRGGVDGIIHADSTSLVDPTAPLSSINLPDPAKTYTFSNTDFIFQLAYGRMLMANLRVGAGVKYIRRSLDQATASGYGVDLGFRWVPVSGVSLGLMIRDITTTRVVWDGGRTDVVFPTMHIGAAYTWSVSEQGEMTISGSSAFGAEKAGYAGFAPWQVLREENLSALGVEYRWRETVSLRAGTQDIRGVLGPGSSRLTAGVGLQVPVGWMPGLSGAGLEVAWSRHTLNDSFRLGVSVDM